MKNSPPLCIDLDGTLLKGDSLIEGMVKSLKTNFFQLLLSLPALFSDRLDFKKKITKRSSGLDFEVLPKTPEVLEFIHQEKSKKRDIILVTAADLQLVEGQKPLVDLFDEIHGSHDVNLKGRAKADFLVKKYPDGFDYVGNSKDDIEVWKKARDGGRFAVNISHSTRKMALNEGLNLKELNKRQSEFKPFLKSMRLHQWLKNSLIAVPFLLNISTLGFNEVVLISFAFLIFGFLTSGTYILNDLMDLEADRNHASKSKRPLASGYLSLPMGVMGAISLITISLCLSFFLNYLFFLATLSYLILTLFYTFIFKKIALLDVIVISTLFTLRIVAGLALLSIPTSSWLPIFSLFFFLSLALMKREIELNKISALGKNAIGGRGYSLEDKPFVTTLGISIGVASIVIFALFISSIIDKSASHYSSPHFLFGILGILAYWLLHMWLIATRGQMDDDPILYAAKNRVSLWLGFATVITAIFAQVL